MNDCVLERYKLVYCLVHLDYCKFGRFHNTLSDKEKSEPGRGSQVYQSTHEDGEVSATHRSPLPPPPRKYSW